MLRVMVLAVALWIGLVEGDDYKKCMKLQDGITSCCKDLLAHPESDNDNIKACFQIPRNPQSCEHDICIGKIRGYASADGTIDMDAMEKKVTEDFKSNPMLIETIKEKCLKGDISKQGPPEVCQLMKLTSCIHIAIGQNCNDWDDSGACSGVKDLTEECIKMFTK